MDGYFGDVHTRDLFVFIPANSAEKQIFLNLTTLQQAGDWQCTIDI